MRLEKAGGERFRRFAWFAIAACGALTAMELLWSLRASLDGSLSDMRLAPTIAMLQGFPLWPDPAESAPQLDMIYGPVAALTWIPAAVQSTPTRAISVGLLLALSLTLLPVAWIVRSETRRHGTLFASTMLLGIAYLLSTPVLPGLDITPDVAAQAFATIALGCAWTEQRRRHAGWRWAGAAAVVASAASKQVMAPLLLVYPAWIAFASGPRSGRQVIAALATIGALSLAVLTLTADLGSVFAATIAGPSRQPWQEASAVGALLDASTELLRRSAPAVALLSLAAFALRRSGPRPRLSRWAFPLAVAVACIPTALLGRVKLGGSVNTLAPVIGFLWIAMLAAYASAGRRSPAVRRTLTSIALVVACALSMRAAPRLQTLPEALRRTPLPTIAFEAVRQAPGTIYFPSRPTINMLAEGRIDHATSGIEYRSLEGHQLDAADVRAFLPPALERVAADGTRFPYVLRYLPAFRRQIVDASLPAWTVLTADDLVMPAPSPVHPVWEARDDRSLLRFEPLVLPGAPATLKSAQVTLVSRAHRQAARLEGVVAAGTPHESVDVEILLVDRSGRHLLTLAATTAIDSAGAVAAEWLLFVEIAQSADRALALVRSGRPSGTASWRLPAAQVRAAAAHALATDETAAQGALP